MRQLLLLDPLLYGNRYVFDLRSRLIVFYDEVVCGKVIEIFDLRIQGNLRAG